MTELKPCPFCGGQPTAIETHMGRGELYCGTCDVVMGGNVAKTPEELTEAWNARAERSCRWEGSLGCGIADGPYDPEEDADLSFDVYEHHYSCGHSALTDSNRPTRYCPVCGSKVVG